jgi:hypothetical protein
MGDSTEDLYEPGQASEGAAAPKERTIKPGRGSTDGLSSGRFTSVDN